MEATITLDKASDRNTPAHWLRIGNVSILFSYATAVALRTFAGENSIAVRKANHWGPTTGRHIKDAGCADYDVVEDDVFEDRLLHALKFAVDCKVSSQ